METGFVKMHGCGNDFVVLDARGGSVLDARGTKALTPEAITPARAAALADRHRGIGCDQVIVIEPDHDGADAAMRILNPDGSEAGACGNATRCVAMLLGAETGKRSLAIRTIAGLLIAMRHDDGRIGVDMGPPQLGWQDIPLAAPADTLHLKLVADMLADPAAASMGNPHATFFVPDIAAVPMETLGPVLEHDPIFPARANIGVVQVLAPDHLRLRVWERGAGLTLACGSGACAALVNAHRRGLAARHATIEVDGGRLEIEWRDDNHVLMTGPAETAFAGRVVLA